MRITPKQPALGTAVVVVALMLSACVPHNNPGGSPTIAEGGSSVRPIDRTAIWPFWPTSMNVHPLTRLTREAQTGRLMLEARVEFLDAQGNRSKAVGDIEMMLFDVGPQGDRVVPLVTWSRDLREPLVNQQHFDVVTRTYLLRLELDPSKLPAQAELRAEFDSLDGQQMRAALKVPRVTE